MLRHLKEQKVLVQLGLRAGLVKWEILRYA
jgi:hypothetical protein